MFITFEGIDGSGKSSQILRLTKFFQSKNLDFISTAEPGGTQLGAQIKKIIFQNPMDNISQLLLMLADRNEHLNEVIIPALKKNKIVLCDRYFDSTYAYQGGGAGIDFKIIENLEKNLNFIRPNLTFLLDINPETALKRRIERNENSDIFEEQDLEYFTKVRQAYIKRANTAPERFVKIDANLSPDKVYNQIAKIILNYIPIPQYSPKF